MSPECSLSRKPRLVKKVGSIKPWRLAARGLYIPSRQAAAWNFLVHLPYVRLIFPPLPSIHLSSSSSVPFMPTAANSPDDVPPPPAASSSLASLRQSLVTALDPRRSTTAASSDGAPAAASATSNTAGVDSALSRSGGANDGELLFMSLGFSEGMLSFPGGGWRRVAVETLFIVCGRFFGGGRSVALFN